MNVLSLFAGIGGLELGLEWAGMTTVGQVEIDPWCRRVLAKHWPDVPRHDDVRTAADWWLSEERPNVDVVAGGFPCQPFSVAGGHRGVGDERWGWPWFAEVVRRVRPRYVVVENVAALLRDRRAFGWVLADLADLGFDAEWSVVSACSMGAPHPRERLLLVAHPRSVMGLRQLGWGGDGGQALRSGRGKPPHWIRPLDGFLEAAGGSRRMVDGVPDAMERARLRGLGNAVVPQVTEHVGRAIMAADGSLRGSP